MSKNPNLPRLLLVEDDNSSRNITTIALKKICEFDIAMDGESAVKLSTVNKYPVILMDIALGYSMNGIEAVRQIRKIPGYENIPIVALTAFAMVGDKDIFLSQGMTHYLAKPFLIKDLKNLITEILKNENLISKGSSSL
jgi:two-component system, sensor histidine kinase